MAKANTKPSNSSSNILEFDIDAIKAREDEVAQETDQSIMDRLRERFQILDDMTRAVKEGNVRAMIVSGPPGVGKSYGVETVLQKSDLFNTLAEKKPKFEVVKGAMSAIGLYAKLYEYSAVGNVIVFDDCDSILMEDLTFLRPHWIVQHVDLLVGILTVAFCVAKVFQTVLNLKVLQFLLLTLSLNTFALKSCVTTWMHWNHVVTTLTYKWIPHVKRSCVLSRS